MRTLFLFITLTTLIPLALSSCESSAVIGGPFPDELTAPRVFTYEPATLADPTTFPTNTLTVVQYNIQSGVSLACREDFPAQVALVAAQKPHFYAFQEVDVNVESRCNCSMPQIMANGTGLHSAFYRTFFFQTGMYGHGSGSLYEILETRSHLFNDWTTERRGILALVTRPPQFGNRTVLLVSNHFQYDNEDTREGQARETISFVEGLLEEFPDALVLMPGDYYTEIGQVAFDILLAYFNNSWDDFNHGSALGGDTHPSDIPANRFDHVWYKKPADLDMYVQDFEVIDSQDSDHRPLSVTFAFPGLDPSEPSPPSAAPLPTPAPTRQPANFPTPAPTSSPVPSPGPATPAPAPSNRPSSPDSNNCSGIQITQNVDSEWVQDGMRYAVYNVVLLNTGSTTITSDLVIVPGSGISYVWGLTENSDHNYILPSYAVLSPHSQYSWGYIRVGGGAASFNFSGCDVIPTVSVTQEVVGLSWPQGGETCSQFLVHVINTSPSSALTYVQLTPSIDFTKVQSWSIVVNGNSLTFPSYVSSIAPNGRYNWGYIYCRDASFQSSVAFTVSAAY